MSHHCAECGALLTDEDTCQSIFERFLILEFTDPGYGRVHFLTVACFMIQHGRYSDEGLVWIQSMLQAYQEDNLTLDQLQKRASQGTSSDTRTWKVTRQPDAAPLPVIIWSMTIADVAKDYEDAQSYCHLVEQWSRVTLKQLTVMLES